MVWNPGIGLANRRAAAAASAIFLVMMAGHTVLETARDSLFLARVPVTRLPFTYGSIAIAVLLAVKLNSRLHPHIGRRLLLAITLCVGGGGSALFLLPFNAHSPWAPHAFYVWIAVVATLAVGQFWLLLSDLFAVSEAKHFYPWISAGGLIGGAAGGVLARASARAFGDTSLVVVGGSLLLLSAVMPGLEDGERRTTAPGAPNLTAGSGSTMRDLRSERYLRRLLGLTLLATLCATLVDYLFKAEVASSVAPKELGSFFGGFNALISGLALVAQFTIAPRLLGTIGIGRALLILPLGFAFAAGGALFAPGLLLIALLKGIDGSLRNSIHRNAIEVLYLPLPSDARSRWKILVDALGQRGGQALSSLVILGCIALGADALVMIGLVLLLALSWLALSLTMERNYLALFRAKIKAGTIETRAEVPALDLRSLESLVSALGSENDDEVLATIELLVDYDRAHVIPALLLFHPSRAVVVRTLEVLASSGRRDFVGAARRLLSRDDDEIRVAAMLALAGQMEPDELRRELGARLPIAARAAVLTAAVARGLDQDGRSAREIEVGCEPSADPETRLAYARAFRLLGDARFTRQIERLAIAAGPPLEQEAARAMLAVKQPAHIPYLLRMLENRGSRSIARDALVAIGPEALQALALAFGDRSLPRQVRAHIPRSVARFGSAAAADILLDQLDREAHGWVRFKIIRALGMLRQHLHEPQRTRRVLAHARNNLSRALHCMAFRIATEADQRGDARLATRGGELLLAILREKELHAIDRAVRLVGLLHSANVIHSIRQALVSTDARLRADGIELLVHEAPTDVAQALTILLAQGADERRLAEASEILREPIPQTSYQERLDSLLADGSDPVRSVAAFHIGELGLTTLANSLHSAAGRASGLSSEVFERVASTLERASAAPEEPPDALACGAKP